MSRRHLAVERLGQLRRSPVIQASGSVMAGQALMAVYGVVTARLLGPDGKGLVTSVVTWSQLLAWAAIAGLGTAMGVEVAGAHDRRSDEAVRHAVANALLITVVVGGALAAVACAVLPSTLASLGPGSRRLTVLGMTAIPVQMLVNLTLMIQVGLGRTWIYGAAQIASPITMIVLGGFLWIVGSGLSAYDVVASAIAGAAVSLWVSCRGLPWRRMRVNLAALRRDLAFGAKVHLGSLLRLTNLRLDYLVMSTYLPAVEVGLYSAANSAMIPISVVPIVASTLLSPRVAGLRDSDDPDSSKATQVALVREKARRYTLWALGGGALICATSPVMVPLVLGEPYRSSILLIWILTPGYVALCFNNIVAAGTAGMKRPWIGTVAEAVAVVVTLGLLPILLPPLGAEGAAIASTAAYSVSAAVAGVGFARLRKQRPDRDGEHGRSDEELPLPPDPGLPVEGL